MLADLLISMLTVGWGLIILLPLLGRIKAGAYLVLAWPIGLLGWAFAAAIHTYLATPFGLVVTPLAGTLSAVALAAVLYLITGRPRIDLVRFPYPGTAAMLALLGVATAVLSRLGISFVTPDSWLGYGGTSVRLADEGILFARLVESRGVLPSAIMAGFRGIGSQWLYTSYQVTALSCLAILAYFVIFGEARRTPRADRIVGAVVAVAGLCVLPFFLFHAAYIHSHMISAVYLLVAVGGLVMATQMENMDPWLHIVALACVGLVMTRPDGFAYSAIPLAASSVLAMRGFENGKLAIRALWSIWGLFVLSVAFVFGSVFLREGVWHSNSKLSGSTVLAMLVLYTVVAAIARLVAYPPRLRAFIARRGLVIMHVAFLLSFPVMLLALPEATATAQIMLENMFREGGWGSWWYLAPGIVALGGLAYAFDRKQVAAGYASWASVGFFATAFAVHATGHPGRLGFADSFNRIAFHSVPIIFMCLGAVVAWAIATLTYRSSASAHSPRR